MKKRIKAILLLLIAILRKKYPALLMRNTLGGSFYGQEIKYPVKAGSGDADSKRGLITDGISRAFRPGTHTRG